MKRVTINVTADHIRRGVCGDMGKCPIALACVDAGLEYPAVDADRIDYEVAPGLRGHSTPPVAICHFVENFDDGKHVDPFAFEMAVEELIDVDARRSAELADDDRWRD